jgi:hypothetical protein
MLENLITVKSFIGKHHSELLTSLEQDKYKDTTLNKFFEQRFHIQNNKVRMVIDPLIVDLTIIITGNEIYISKKLFDHPSVIVSNSIESTNRSNIKKSYDPGTFSTLAYLLCQNQTTIQIVDEIDEPIYILRKSDYECFQNSIIIVDILDNLNVEIIEEIESFGALNSVTNYILHPDVILDLTTFYKGHISSLTFCYRNIIVDEGSTFNHTLFGKGSSIVIDETDIRTLTGSETKLMGVINSQGKNFHTILNVESLTEDYSISVNYKDILWDKADVSFFPTILGNLPVADVSPINISNIAANKIPFEETMGKISEFISDIVDNTILIRMEGVKRFYDNKSAFVNSL